ncbi:MAG: DMT family transporter [Blastocatellia bacterium]|jgi:drug/metabolite transporter (DMT)-like permease|nr:DMT family transporter [Blastocatellia bacterium]MBK6425815.1 DMT family transporter [Blastocatellia bacterium]
MSDPMISADSIRAESAPDRRTEPAAHVALLAVQVFFSTLPIAAKYHVLPHMPPAGLVMLRVLGGAIVLMALARARGRLTILDRRDFVKIGVYALLGVTINQLLFIEGLSRTTAINAQVIATTIPAFTLGFGVMLGIDRLSWLRVVGILMAASGAIYLVGPDRIEFTPDTTIGNAMIAVNAVAYSLYLVLAKPMLAKYDSVSVMAWVFLFGAIGVLPFGAVSLASSGALVTMPGSAWAGVAFIILIPTVGSYLLNAWALKRSAPSIVATYVYLQPLLTGLLAVMMQGEPIDPRAIPSAALIFAGVALTTRRQPDAS